MKITVTIESLAYGGNGIARDETRKVIFVPFTAPGDEVLVQITKEHKNFSEGKVLEFIKKSPFRIEPQCPVFGECGGCQWQHLDYATQLKSKETILLETLTRIGKLEKPSILPIIPSPSPWHYRKRIQLKKNPNGALGFHAAKSHDVVEFDECFITDPEINQKIRNLKKEKTVVPNHFELSLDHHKLTLTSLDINQGVFSQVNEAQNHKLVETVLNFAFGHAHMAFTKKMSALELYAGSGNFTFPIARKAGTVIAVEENMLAVERAEDFGREHHFSNIEWIRGTSEWGLKKIYRAQSSVDLLIMDPPRSGAHDILDLILLIKPRSIVYVSCDPTTLARDLRELTRREYQLMHVQPIDMFPQTYHIESVCFLSLI